MFHPQFPELEKLGSKDPSRCQRASETFSQAGSTYPPVRPEPSPLAIANNPTVRELATLSRVWSPNLVFLCETRQNKNKMRSLRNKLGLKGFVGSSSVGLSGGLALFWHENVSVEIQSINEIVIDAYVRLQSWLVYCPRYQGSMTYNIQIQNYTQNCLNGCGSSSVPDLIMQER
jgi:hypothetical protein